MSHNHSSSYRATQSNGSHFTIGQPLPGNPDADQAPSKLTSAPVIALFVLGSLVAVIGVIYAYLYVTKINPRPSRARKYMDSGADDDATGQGTHLFLFRRS
jgi:hypothetical protein